MTGIKIANKQQTRVESNVLACPCVRVWEGYGWWSPGVV